MAVNVFLQKLAELGAKPALIQAMTHLSSAEITTLIGQIDESHYSLHEWCETIIAFDEWSIANQKDINLSWKLEYLYCCVQGTINDGHLLPLRTVWENYVEAYGVGG